MRQGQYDGKVDIFALGCIMAEMYTGVPLFPGTSEDDMLYRLSNVIGQPPLNMPMGNRNRTQFSTMSAQLKQPFTKE